MKIVNRKGETEFLIYEDIGADPFFHDGATARAVIDALKAAPAGDTILVRINSPGGDVFEGMAIYNALVNSKREVITQVDGMAFSAASYIFMASKTRRMAENAFLMIHEAWSFAMGTASEMRERAQLLEEISSAMGRIYEGATGIDAKTIDQWMAAETYFTINPEGDSVLDAIEHGFATEMIANLKLAASFDPKRFHVHNVPKEVRPLVMTPGRRASDQLARMGKRAIDARRRLTAS